jgi:hypothetical protein
MSDVGRLEAALLADQHIAQPALADLLVQRVAGDPQELQSLAGADHHPAGGDLLEAF